MPPRHDRRRRDKLLLGCTVICVICTIVTVVVIPPTVLDTQRLGEANQDRIADVARLGRENATLTRRLEREGRKRRDQSCKQDERRHLDDVNRLRRTYMFLEHLPRSEWGTNLTVAILRQLPEIERDARHDVAPKFCDEPGIGLPEPDPRLPEHRDFSRLLHRP